EVPDPDQVRRARVGRSPRGAPGRRGGYRRTPPRGRLTSTLLARSDSGPYAPRVARVLALIAIALSLLVAVAGPARAAERLRSYDVDITIEPHGSLEGVEAIEYDFGATPNHGI